MQIAEQYDSRESHAAHVASQAVAEGLTKRAWGCIERRASPFQQQVFACIVAYAQQIIKGSGTVASIEIHDKKVMGESFYTKIRKIFLDHGIIVKELKKSEPVDAKDSKSGKKEKKEKKVVVKKADAFRAANAIKSVQTVAADVVKSYNWDILTPHLGFRSQYIEIVGITFMYMARFILKKRNMFTMEKNIGQVWSLMVSMQRYLDACASYIGIDPVNPGAKASISAVFLADMQDCYDDINNVFPFDGASICQRAPELLVSAPLDEYVPATSIQPRDHQKEMIAITHDDLKADRSSFSIYNAMINSGKTTTVSALLEIVKHHEKILLCVCNLETVREQMCNSFYNASQSFAVAYVRNDNTIKLSQSWSTKGTKISAIVCGPEVAFRLLTEDNKMDGLPEFNLPLCERFVLFHDEPTIGSDDVKSKSLSDNMKVLINAPKWTIFSSATSPTQLELEPLISRLRNCYSDLVIHSVYSPTVYVSCEVRTQKGDLVVPFLGCKTAQDLRQVIQKINDMPFLGRMLTFNVALHLYTELSALNAKNVPDIPTMFKKVSNLKADKIREIVLVMLELLASQCPESIEKLCSSRMLDTEQIRVSKKEKEDKKTDDEDLGFEWESTSDHDEKVNMDTSRNIDFNQLGTGVIWKGMTLITDTDPVDFILTHFQPLLTELAKVGIKSARRLVDAYIRDVTKWRSVMEKTLNNLEVSETEKALKENEMLGTRPKTMLPEWAQVGTTEYCKHFINQQNRAKVMDTRVPNYPETIIDLKIEIGKKQTMQFIDVTTVPDELLLLLMCGVGVYAPTHRSLDQYYNDLVLEYATYGKMAYVGSDISIVFGTNQPYGRVIPTARFVKGHSVQVFFQTIARAGRVGKLAKAEAIVAEDTARMLVDYTIHPERYDIEAKNMKMIVEFFENEKQQALATEIARLEKEMADEEAIQDKIQKSVEEDIRATEFVSFNEFADDQPEKTSIPIKVETSIKLKDRSVVKSVESHTPAWDDEDVDLAELVIQAPPLCTSTDNLVPGRTSPPIVPISKVIDRDNSYNQKKMEEPAIKARAQVQQDPTPLSWRRVLTNEPPVTTKIDHSPLAPKTTHDVKHDTRYVPPALRQCQDNSWRSDGGQSNGRSDNRYASRQDTRGTGASSSSSYRSRDSQGSGQRTQGFGSNDGRSWRK